MDTRGDQTGANGFRSPRKSDFLSPTSLSRRRSGQRKQRQMIYADASFLFSLYAWDVNTGLAAKVYRKDARRPLIFVT